MAKHIKKGKKHFTLGSLQTGPVRALFLIPVLLLFAIGVFYFGSGSRDVGISMGCQTVHFSGEFETVQTIAELDGKQFAAPQYELPIPQVANANILGASSDDSKWIEIDLSRQQLTAWQGGQVFLQTPVSSGLPWSPTPTGEFRIWIKLRYTRMEGGEGKYYYNLPNVPYTMFFSNSEVPAWKGYGLHGTYWHNDFGRPHSHGCVNLPTPVAEKLFYWTQPVLADGKKVVRASNDNLGTKIVIHN